MKKSIRQTVHALTIALLLPASFAAAASSDPTQLRKEATQLTQRLEDSARKIQKEADQLQSMRMNPRLSDESHWSALNNVKEQVNNEMRPSLQRLVEIQSELPGWHQDAIDQLRVSAANLAAHANEATSNRSDRMRTKPLMDQEYAKLLDGLNNHATKIIQVADATGDYGKAQLKGNEAGLAIAAHD